MNNSLLSNKWVKKEFTREVKNILMNENLVKNILMNENIDKTLKKNYGMQLTQS